MNRTLKSLLGAAVLVAFVAPVAMAQTGSLQGQRTIFNDGGTTVGTFNRIYLQTPADATLVADYSLILPPNNGNANDILFTPDGNGTLEFNSGDGLFWKLTGNTTTFVDGTNNLLGTLTATPLNIITGGTTRIRVLSTGQVGIGTSPNTSFLLDVAGDANVQGFSYLRKNAFFYDAVNGYLGGNITAVEPGGVSGDATKLGIYGGRNTGGIILYTNVANAQTEVMRLTSDPNAAIGGRISIKAGSAPNALVSVGGGAGGNLTIDDNGNLVTAGNITINGTGTNTIGGATTTNNITGTNTLLGLTSINVTGTSNTLIGSTTGGNVTIGVNDGTTNLTLNGITDVAPTGADDILWITDVTNQVRRTSFGGLVEQGLTFDAESGVTKIRLGGLSTISNPFAADRYVNLDVYDLTFTAAGGTRTLLDLNGDATDGSFQLNSFGNGEGFITSNRKTFIVNNGVGLPALFVQNTNGTQDSWLEVGDPTGTGHLAIGINNPGGASFINSSTSRPLDVRMGNIVEATFSTTGLNIVNNLTVGDNATIGNADADQHLIRGVTDINTTAANAATTIGATTNTGAVAVASGTTITTNSLGLTSVTAGTGVDVTATTGDIDVTSSAGHVNITSGGVGNDVTITSPDGEVFITANGTAANGDVELYADSDFNVLVRDDIDLFATSNDGAVTANIVLNSSNTANATNAGVTITSGGSFSNTAGTTYSLIAPTANLNTSTSAASTTNIGNNTNGVTNIYGAGVNGLTITGNNPAGAPGDNTIVIDPGEASVAAGDEYDLILNNIKVENPIQDLLWLTAGNEVRKTNFAGTANEGLQFQNSAYRLGVGFTTDASPWDEKSFLEDRYVNLNRSTLFFTTNNSTRALLELNGDEYSGSTHLFSYGVGNITLDADSNDVILSANGALGMVQLNATNAAGDIDINAGDQLTMDASDVTVTATDDLIATVSDLMDVNVGDLDLDATATITQTSAGNSVYEATGGSLRLRTTGAAGGSNDVLITSNDEILMAAPVATTVEATGANGILWLHATGANGNIRMEGTSTIRQRSTNLNLNFDYATASTTRIGNNTNAVVNIAGFNNNGVTITGAQNAAGDNTIVIDPGATTADLVMNNIATSSAPVNMLSLDGSGQVRQKALTGMADEGLQYDGTDGEFKLGHATDGSSPIVSDRYVRLSTTAGPTVNTLAYTWLDGTPASRNLLTLASNGTVGINTTGAGVTNIGSSAAGAITATANANISLAAEGSGNISLTATLDDITGDAAIINLDGTSSVDINTDVAGTTNVGANGNTSNLLSSTIEVGKGAYATAVNIGTTANTTTTVLGTTNINRAGGSTTQIGANGNTVELLASTNNIGTDNFATTNTIGRTSTATNNILGTTNINNVAGGDNTVIGNTGAGATTVTINAGTTGNIVLGGVDTDNTPDYMVSLDASPTGNVRLKQLTSMADEGLQYDGTDGEFKLGSSTTGTGSPITSSRFVNVGAGGTLTFRDATNTKLLVLNNNGNVELNTSSTGTTTIGSSSAGAVAVTANANISLEAVGTGDITFTATGDAVNTNAQDISLQGSATVDMDAPAITINDTGSGTTQIGNASAGTILVRSASTITGTAGSTMDLNMADLDVDASASIDLNAGSTLTLNANATPGGVVAINATGAGNDIDINANDDVTIDATDIVNTASATFAVSAPTTNINTATSSTTNIGNTTNGAVNILGNGTNGVTITGSGTTTNSIKIDPGANNNLILDNISSLSPVLDLLWITNNNEVRRAPFTATADEGLEFESSAYRLGVAAPGDGTPYDDKSFLVDRYVNLNTSSLFFTTNNANTALLELNGSAANGSVNMFSYGTGNITLQAGSNDVVLNANSATGMVQLNATNAAGDIDINAGDQLTLDAADVTIDASDVLTLEGATASLSTITGDITVNLPAAGDLVLNGVDSDNTVLTYLGVTGSNEVREVSLNATAWLLGGNTLTGTQTIGSNSAHDVGIETSGVTRLTFTAAGAITQGASAGQVTFTGNVDATNGLDVTNADLTVGGSNFVVDDATGNISNLGTTTFGDGVSADNATFNLGAAGVLTINNDNAVNNLSIQETAISRTGDLAINTSGNTITTNGSVSVQNNLTVGGTAALGDGAGTDNVTIATGSGSLNVTGLTNINVTGANSTNIGSTSNAGIVDIESQSNINLTTAGTGTVAIQGSNNGSVVIGNASTNTITVVGTVGVNTTTASNTNIGTGSNTGTVTLGNTGNDVVMAAPATFQRSMNVKFNTIGATTTLDESYHVVLCQNAVGINVFLPAAATAGAGRVYVIKSAGAGDVVIDPDGVETIEGLANFTITGGGNLTRTIVSSGTAWYVIGN